MEYTLLIGIVVMVLTAIAPMLKRAAQGMIKLVSDHVGNQRGAEQEGGEDGYLKDSYTLTRADRRKKTLEYMGETNYVFDGTETMTDMITTSNLGFAERKD